MKTIKVFVDTSIVNRILDIGIEKSKDILYEEDRHYLSKIMQEYVDKGIVQLFANPSIKLEIENTSDHQRKQELLTEFKNYHFTDFNKTVFPFSFPATFVTEEEKLILEELRTKIKNFNKDAKIFLDAVSNSQIDALVTADREHLACIEVRGYVVKKLDARVEIFTPKEFYEYIRKNGF